MFHRKSRACRGRKIAAMMAACGASLLFCGHATAQTPTLEDNMRDSGAAAHASICALYGCSGSGGGSGPRIGYDPCYLAQNALRPCTSADLKAIEPKGVDPDLVGTWEIPFKTGFWVLEIAANGAYKFHSEAKDAAKPHSGTFAASNGHWMLKATTGYSDAGLYLYQAPAIFIATGKKGAAAWERPALAQEAMRPCAPGQRPAPKPAAAKSDGAKANVDPDLTGTWELALKSGGPWVWEILPDGSYKFHTEGLDLSPPHAGAFSAGTGHWSLRATRGIPGYTDTGLYLFQPPNVWIATGHMGASAWLRPAAATCMP